MIKINIVLMFLKFGVSIEETEAGKLGKLSSRIIGGHPAFPYSYPFMISLQFAAFEQKQHFCGGTLITHKWIMTASHCVEQSFVEFIPIVAMAGAYFSETKYNIYRQVIPIYERIMHPDYDNLSFHNDIAMMSTVKPFKLNEFIKPATLPYGHKISNNTLTIIGWGSSQLVKDPHMIFIPEMSYALHELYVTKLPFEVCAAQLGEVLWADFRHDIQICSGPFDQGACIGDSGGPLIDYAQLKPAVPVVVGVISYTVGNCTGPRVYVRVEKYLDFIQYYIYK